MSDINDYVFEGEGSEPSIDNSEAAQNSTESLEEFVFGTEAEADAKLVIPAPTTTNIGKYLRATGAYICEWQDVSLEDITVPWGNLTGTLADQTDLQAALDAKVNTVAGYGLSQNDLTNTLKSTYDGYAASIAGKEDTGVAAGLLASHNSTYTHTDIALNTADRHSHDNKATLDLISEAFTTALKATYDGYAASISNKQDANASLTSLAALSYVSTSFVKMTGANTFVLDTATYEPTLTKGNLTASGPLSFNNTRQVIGGAAELSIQQADTDNDGYLSSTDWDTFNGKQNALGYTAENQSNKSNDTALGTSATLYPTQNAVKTYIDNRVPAGVIMAYAGSSVPDGWLDCDGSAVNRTTYATLFTAISTTWGIGDGSTTFNLPDLRSATLRGVGTPTIFTSNTVVALADTIDDKLQGHYHVFNNTLAGSGASGTTRDLYNNEADNNTDVKDPVTDGANGTPRTGLETTGKARGVYFIIKT